MMFVVVRGWTSKSGCGLLISVFRTFELGKTHLEKKNARDGLIDSPHTRLVVVPQKDRNKTAYSCSTVASLATEKKTEN